MLPMSLVKLLVVVAIALTLNSAVALGPQNSQEPWDFSCRKWEDREWQPCGDTPFILSRKFQIGHSDGTPVGYITIVNRTRRPRTLEYLEISPAFNADDLQQPYWFTGGEGSVQVAPGRKLTLIPQFIGRKKASRQYARRPWVSPGTHEGTMKLRDKATGTVYEFKFIVKAYK
jgi:hypothetical protein